MDSWWTWTCVLLCTLLTLHDLVSSQNGVRHGQVNCNTTDAYHCVTSSLGCIARYHVNDSIRDCPDNSDEVARPCKEGAFSCKSGRPNCLDMNWVLDGRVQCGDDDDSDEAKVIGSACYPPGEECMYPDETVPCCCPCDQYITDSVCAADRTCQCKPGYYSDIRGLTCTIRRLGDVCSVDEDCSLIEQGVCQGGVCHCPPGHYSNSEGNTCTARKIGDRCDVAEDCSPVINMSTCDKGQCVCQAGHYSNSHSTNCIPRYLYDTCSSHDDCSTISNGVCQRRVCVCGKGFRPEVGSRRVCSPDGYLHSPCNHDDDCHVINGSCVEGMCSCYDTHIPFGKFRCVRLRLGDYCHTSGDCSRGVAFSVCVKGTCTCAKMTSYSVSEGACIYLKDRDTLIAVSCVLAIIVLLVIIIAACIVLVRLVRLLK